MSFCLQNFTTNGLIWNRRYIFQKHIILGINVSFRGVYLKTKHIFLGMDGCLVFKIQAIFSMVHGHALEFFHLKNNHGKISGLKNIYHDVEIQPIDQSLRLFPIYKSGKFQKHQQIRWMWSSRFWETHFQHWPDGVKPMGLSWKDSQDMEVVMKFHRSENFQPPFRNCCIFLKPTNFWEKKHPASWCFSFQSITVGLKPMGFQSFKGAMDVATFWRPRDIRPETFESRNFGGVLRLNSSLKPSGWENFPDLVGNLTSRCAGLEVSSNMAGRNSCFLESHLEPGGDHFIFICCF